MFAIFLFIILTSYTKFEFNSLRNNEIAMKLLITGLVYTISDHFSCRIVFMDPIHKMLRSVGVYTKSHTEFGSRAYRIHTEPCKKTPIRYETESDPLVIRYHVNGATVIFGCRDIAKVRNDVIFKQWR